MTRERTKQSIKKGRALRHFTLSKGKSAGRNSSGRITAFHRGGGSKRLLRKIDLKRSTPSIGIVERIEYDPNRSCRIALVRWIEGVPPPSPRRPSGIRMGLEKHHGNTPFAPFRDVPFALRGALGSSNSSFYSKDGLKLSSSLEQLRGCLSSPLGTVRPKMSPPGSRSLHTSQPLSVPAANRSLSPHLPLKMSPPGSRSLHTSRSLSVPAANRPLSPHLPLKKPQFSATFSISHRIFGAALGAAIISIPLATKFSLMFDVSAKCSLK